MLSKTHRFLSQGAMYVPPAPHSNQDRQQGKGGKRRLSIREFETLIQEKDKNYSKTTSSLKHFPSCLWPRATDTLKTALFKRDEMKEIHFFGLWQA